MKKKGNILHYIGPVPEDVMEDEWIEMYRQYPNMSDQEKLDVLGKWSKSPITRMAYSGFDFTGRS